MVLVKPQALGLIYEHVHIISGRGVDFTFTELIIDQRQVPVVKHFLQNTSLNKNF